MTQITLGSTGIQIEKNGFGCLPIQRISRDEAAYLLHNEDGKGIGDTEQGTLDVSHQLEDGSLRPTWSPGSITASDSAASDSAQTEPAGEGDTGQGDGTAQTDEGTDGQTDGAEGGDQAAQTDTAGAAATPEPTAEPAA